ncbi:MAG: amidohydrolase [Sphingobacteriales bacterium]|nr:amidohydrolase [Sphingobacteriales bacterium]
MKKFVLIILLPITFIFGCMKKKTVDLIVFNAKIYTVDSLFSTAEAVAIAQGKFVAAGTTDEILHRFKADKMLDLKGKTVYPGFIDAHSHFYGYGLFAQRIDLTATTSFEEILDIVKKWADENPEGWIIGRGWDQNKWKQTEYPDNQLLNELFPDRPVMLTRVDGHAVLVNNKALEISGLKLNENKKFAIFKKDRFTGILLDNAADIVKDAANHPADEEIVRALKVAQEECFKSGLTTICDAGQKVRFIEIMDKLQQKGELKIRIYAMLDPEDESVRFINEKGIFRTGRLTVRAIKLYADGALGSRGACLLMPYSDMPETKGSILFSNDFYSKYCEVAYASNYQVCMHAIGDSANRFALTLFAGFLKTSNDRRWRIEHAQVINEADFGMFGKYNIIPSVQFVHAVSDMGWAEKRLGSKRLQNAYAYKKLMSQNGWIPYGSDFPVEEVNPLPGFYAAVFRKNFNGEPEGGFLPENAISRQEALKAMTIWAAKACFEENDRGSIESGKAADFVVMDTDLLNADEKQIRQAKVLKTFVGGEEVFSEQLNH